MFEISVWSFFISLTALILIIFILVVRSFGIIKLKHLNSKKFKELQKLKLSTNDLSNKRALSAIINHYQSLNSKWVLEESDLKILDNSYELIKKIACAYYPDSKHPAEEARITSVLNAFKKLKNQLIELTTWRGVHAATQFRIRHVVTLSHAWNLRKSLNKSESFIFLKKRGLLPFFDFILYAIRWIGLTIWATRMIVYVIQDIVCKVFLVRWYLLIGDLAIQIYSQKGKYPDTQPETILEDLSSMPMPENQQMGNLPEKIKIVAEFSKNKILYHIWSVEWKTVKEIYIKLLEDIAQKYYPEAKQPIYEAKLSEMLTCGIRFFEQIESIQTYPFLNKILSLRIAHILLAKDTTDFLSNNQALAWLRKHNLTQIFKYSILLFKTVEKKHPTLIFKDFAFILASEGCKRWFYLYLHEKITTEANALYQRSQELTPS